MGEATDILDRYHLKKLRAKFDEILIVGSTYPGGGFLMNYLLRNRSRVHGSEVVGSPQTRLPSLPDGWQAGVGQV